MLDGAANHPAPIQHIADGINYLCHAVYAMATGQSISEPPEPLGESWIYDLKRLREMDEPEDPDVDIPDHVLGAMPGITVIKKNE